MSKLPQLSGRELVKVFLKDGWFKVSQRGSHIKLRKNLKPVGKATVIVPLHKTLKRGTLSGILKDSEMSLEKLKDLL